MASPPHVPPPPVPPPPPQLRRTPRWGLGDALLAFVLAALGGVIGSVIAIQVTGAKALPDGSYAETGAIIFGAVVGQYGAWLACMYVTSRIKGVGSLRADFGLVVHIVRDWPMVPLGLALEIVAALVLLPISRIVDEPQNVVHELDTAGGAKLAVLVVTAVLIAPVVEELFFRGLLLRSLQRRFSAVAAVAVSGLAFGLAHVLFDWSGSGPVLPALVALGMISGIFAVRTGNLSRSILLHAGFNLLAVLAVLTNR